jgi:hypothetical protein
MTTAAAILFALAAGGAIAFQLGLAAGASWGSIAMGGRYPGSFPPRMRAAAVVQAAVLAFLLITVLSDARIALTFLSEALPWLVWLAVAFSGISLALNAMSSSARERQIWVPVAIVMLVSSLVVAIS